ncbi:MAG: hypothetical protein K2Q22_16790, partial [Cytophagales bacterium]|nr:hypothetical protein [Cytophagales bacterium]
MNQCNLNGPVTANNGTNEVLALGTVRNYTNKDLKWVHHDNVAYIFPVGSNLTVQNLTQSGNWYNVATSQANFPVTGDVFSVYFNHGVKPVNADYQYIVAPRLDISSVPAFSANHGFVVSQNDTNIQAVKNTRLNTFGAVFYHPGTVDMGAGMRISSNKPAIVFIERTTTGCNISVADPLYINNNSITLTISSAFKGVAVSTTTSIFTTQMPTTVGDSVGSSVIKFYPYLIAPALVATTISGPSVACVGTNVVYQASTAPGISGYTWSVPSGYTIASGQGTRTILLNVGTASGTISVLPVVNSNSIPVGDIQTISVNRIPIAPQSILGNATVCSGSVSAYQVATVTGATAYAWGPMPSGAVLLSGQNSSQIS